MATVVSGDCFTKKLVEDVQSTFKRLEIALKARETQILRQIDVILQQYALNNTGNPKFQKINVVFHNEVDILKAVSNFGIIDFEGISFENNIYQIEDYENPNCDHICLHKCLKKLTNAPDVVPNEQDTNEKLNETAPSPSSPIEKVSSDTIVKNLHSYASTLKSLQSNENLHALAKNMEIKIFDHVKYTADINENQSFESSFTSDSRNSTDELNDSSSSTSKIMSDHSSFEFHESSIENTPKMQKECTKNFYNRHESRYAKISMSNLVESEDEFKECTPVIDYDTIKSQFNSKNDLVNEINESNEVKTTEIIINENPSTPEVQVASKINLEYPIQQWMQQISREPELEPIQNNELMEHVNITTML